MDRGAGAWMEADFLVCASWTSHAERRPPQWRFAPFAAHCERSCSARSAQPWLTHIGSLRRIEKQPPMIKPAR